MGKTLEQLLRKMGVTPDVVQEASQEQAEHGGYLREKLLSLGVITRETFAQSVSHHLGVPFADMDTRTISDEVLHLLTRDTAEKYGVLPLEFDSKHRRLSIAIADPTDMSAIDELKFVVGYTLIPHYTPEDELKAKIAEEYGRLEEQQTVATVWAAQSRPSETRIGRIDVSSLAKAESTIMKVLGAIFVAAAKRNVDEIRLQPGADGEYLYFGKQGKFGEVTRFPHKAGSPLRTKLKRLLGIEPGETPNAVHSGYVSLKLPQNQERDLSYLCYPDGSHEYLFLKMKGRAILPALTSFGLDSVSRQAVQDALSRSHGALFVAGTAQSGLTTTLYAFLNAINTADRTLYTLEDPIECRFDGMIQGQLSRAPGTSYDEYLRALLVQRPDVVMIDKVLGARQMQQVFALSSGSLVMNSLPATDGASALMKLLLMSSAPIVADQVVCVTAQRLVGKICDACKEKVVLAAAYREKLGLASEDECYLGKGCDQCEYSGYYGLTPIFEVVPLTSELQQAVMEGAHLQDLRKLIAAQNSLTLRDDGMRKVKQGITTVQEVLKATML